MLKENCCGCGLCSFSCPKKAIQMIENKEGFLSPFIDKDKCINCGICEKVCIFNQEINDGEMVKKIYGAMNNDDNIRLKSSSGGIFTAIAHYVLENKGIVYGVELSNKTVQHSRINDITCLYKLNGSKYVQSNMMSIYKSIIDDLKKGLVLFSGTPCQVDAIKTFVKKFNVNYSNLITVDIICHGVGSPRVFNDYLLFLENKYNSKIDNYMFRSKKLGWHAHEEVSILENKKVKFLNAEQQIYKYLFYSNSILRPSCHTCKYSSQTRVSDITLGDFRGIEKVDKEFDDDKGLSVILVNSNKGIEIINKISNKIIKKEYTMKDVLQHNLVQPTPVSENRKEFWDLYELGNLEKVYKKFAFYDLKFKIKCKIKLFLYKLNVIKS